MHRGKNRLVESRFDVPPQRLLIVLDRKEVVAATLDDLGGNRFLAEDRIARDDLARQVEPLQQFERIGNFESLACLLYTSPSPRD